MHPFSFTYVVPLSAHVDFSHRFYYPTGSFEVMFDDPSLKLESKQLQYAGSRQQGGKKYEMYTGSGFGVGQEASVRIVGASIWTSPILYGWMAAVLAIIAVLYVALRRGRRAQAIADAARGAEAHEHLATLAAPPAPAAARAPAPAAPPPPPRPDGAPNEFATAYLCLISALDQANARGELSPDAYALLRTNLKRKLEVVLSNGATQAQP